MVADLTRARGPKPRRSNYRLGRALTCTSRSRELFLSPIPWMACPRCQLTLFMVWEHCRWSAFPNRSQPTPLGARAQAPQPRSGPSAHGCRYAVGAACNCASHVANDAVHVLSGCDAALTGGATAQADPTQQDIVGFLAAALLSCLHLPPWEERLAEGSADRLKLQPSKTMMQHGIAQLIKLSTVPSATRMFGGFSPFCDECGTRMFGLTQLVSEHRVIRRPCALTMLATLTCGRATS